MKIKNVKLQWYAFRYDSNKNKIVFINVLSGMEEEIVKKIKKGAKDKWQPVTDYNSFKEWLRRKLMYYYWCKSEHECLIGDWCSDPEETLEKHDIWWQLEPNLDRIVEYIINEFKIDFKNNRKELINGREK